MTVPAEHMKQLGYELANRPLALIIFETVLLVVIALTALVGNSCVLYVFYKTPRLRTVTSYYIITLAISDVVMAVVVLPVSVTGTACGRDVVGAVVGEGTFFMFTALVFGSLQTTSLIAINRYFCVVKPPKYRIYFKPKFVALMIVGCWLVATGLTATMFVSEIAKFVFFPGRCMYFAFIINNRLRQVLTTIYQVFFTIIPAASSLFCYWKIYRRIKIHSTSVASTFCTNNPSSSPPSLAERRLTKSLMAVVVGFIICWIPNSTILNITSYIDLPRVMEVIMINCAFLSSAINPILYNVFNKPFRRRAWQLLRPRCRLTNTINIATNDSPN